MAALPDARLLQAMTYTLLEAGEKTTNPPMVVTKGAVRSDVSIFAGGLTWSPYKEWDFFLDYVAAQRKNGATAAFTIFDKWIPDTSAAVQSESKKSQS